MEVFRHLLRTIVQVLVLTVIFIVFVTTVIWLKLPPIVIPIGIVVLFGGYIYVSARWHPYWAPIANVVERRPWRQTDGKQMETVVENAIVQAGMSVRSITLRVSVYEKETGKRLHSQLVGDDAEYLGGHGIGLWFFISDRFYARKDGLVCLDPEACRWIYHRPLSEVCALAAPTRRGIITVELASGEEQTIQLAQEEAHSV